MINSLQFTSIISIILAVVQVVLLFDLLQCNKQQRLARVHLLLELRLSLVKSDAVEFDRYIPTFISKLLRTALRTEEVRADTSDLVGF
jgi:hypothetical protein